MAVGFQKKYTKRAKERLDRCHREYGQEVRDQLIEWERLIMSCALDKKDMEYLSFSLLEFFEENGFEGEVNLSFLSDAKRRGVWETIGGVLHFLKTLNYPWKIRVSVYPVRVFYETVECVAIVEIDYVKKRVIFREFIDLPGQ